MSKVKAHDAPIHRELKIPADEILRLDGVVDKEKPGDLKFFVQSDFTFTVAMSLCADWIREQLYPVRSAGGENTKSPNCSIDTQVSIVVVSPANKTKLGTKTVKKSLWEGFPTKPMLGRLLACRCHSGEQISLTVRIDQKSQSAGEKHLNAWLETTVSKLELDDQTNQLQKLLRSIVQIIPPRVIDPADSKWAKTGYCASTKRSGTLPIAIADICDVLHQHIFLQSSPAQSTQKSAGSLSPPSAENLQGAVLLAGRTKSAKSLVTRGLIQSFLAHRPTFESLAGSNWRRPHLVTCEDPVEVFFEQELGKELHRLIDYSPRDRTIKDYTSLSECFSDALRQTPACVFVGEARTDEDIRAILDFAATGHLVFATMHAGSLVDVFTRVFVATKARTAAERGLVGQRLLSVVHLQQLSETILVDSEERIVSTILPALWHRTPASTASLVSAGAGALMPNNPDPDGQSTPRIFESLGRQYFCNLLLRNAQNASSQNRQQYSDMRSPLVAAARALDLRGM